MKQLFEIIVRMSAVHRFSTRLQVHPETLLEHTSVVGLIVLKIIGDMKESGLFAKIGMTPDDEIALYQAVLLHDLDEISIGDIPRPTKYALGDLRELIHKLESTGMESTIRLYELPTDWYKYWDSAHCGRSGLILVIADLLAVVYKYWRERMIFGNRMFDMVGQDLLKELQRFDDQMTQRSDTFCAKFALDLSIPGNLDFLYFLRNVVMSGISVLQAGEKDMKFQATSII